MPDGPQRRTALEIPWRTIFKLIAAAALIWVGLRLIELFLVVIVAVLLAVTLNPLVARIERQGLPRWGAATIVSVTLIAVLTAFVWVTWATLSSQIRFVAENSDTIRDQLMSRLPSWLQGDRLNLDALGPYAMRFVRSAATALLVSVLGFILTIYLLIEGRETRDWLLAFVPRDLRPKVAQTLEEAECVVFAYVAGNVLTSLFAAVFVFVALTILRVPATLLLAVIAGLMDFVPVLGFAVSVLPAAALASTVSVQTTIMVVALYIAYHFIENYFIAPKVYGGQLKLSNVAVIIAFAIGAALAGVIGALIALPIAAAYPAVERIWLRDHLADDTVRKHRTIERRRVG